MTTEFLTSAVIIFGISAVVIFILGRFKTPSIVGFLIAGMIIGPHGFGFINDVRNIELLAEIGVILLMFTIGIEFSLKNLFSLKRLVLGGGLLQSALTILMVIPLSMYFFSQDLNKAIFDGLLISLSSTAIVIKILMDKSELNTTHGRAAVGILIFQDLCVIPYMMLLPALSGQAGGLFEILWSVTKAMVVIALVLLTSKWGTPHLLHEVVKTRSRELFVMTIILLCLGIALLTHKLGLSLALGAFLAGVIISESEYASQAVSDILPFKESFSGLFFISIGMLLDFGFFSEHFLMVMTTTTCILLLKIIAGALAVILVGHALRHSLLTGFYICQIGEFSFILASEGRKHGLIGEDIYQIFLVSSVITMMLTPFLASLSHNVSAWVSARKAVRKLDRYKKTHTSTKILHSKLSGHVVIIGFGVIGTNLAKVLAKTAIPYVVLEMNALTVTKMKKLGQPIYYGDGTSIEILHKLGINQANMAVIAISDPAATRRITQIIRTENKQIYILVRTRYVLEVEDLKALGANEVIPEEFETAIEIFSRALHYYHVPINIIHKLVAEVRKDNYGMLRNIQLPQKPLADRHDFIKDIVSEFFVFEEGSWVIGKSIAETSLRAKTGATIIAVQRADKIFQNPQPDFVFEAEDVIMLIGSNEQIDSAVIYLSQAEDKSKAN